MRRLLVILILVLEVLLPVSLYARKGEKKEVLTTEQEQQFTYYWYAAREAIEKEDYPRALVLLEFCDAIKPNDGRTLSFLGTIYNGIGQRERAMDAFKRAFEVDPRDQWDHYAFALLKSGTETDRKQAQQVMERALKVNPKDEDLLRQLLHLYIQEEQWKKALNIQDRLDAVKGYDAYSALNRYRIYAMWDKPKKALAAIDKYLELEPTNIQFLLFRVEILERMNAKPADLYAAYDKVLAIHPGHIGILNNYAYHLATHKGDLQRAERMSEQTIRENPNYPVYLDTYGWILHLKGQDELAKFYLNKALDGINGGMYLFENDDAEKVKNEVQKHLNAIK